MSWAITTVAEREAPARQCTSTRPASSAPPMNAVVASKCASIAYAGSSGAAMSRRPPDTAGHASTRCSTPCQRNGPPAASPAHRLMPPARLLLREDSTLSIVRLAQALGYSST
eukprot:2039526-Prymnesium_polylepis.1